MSQAQVIQNLLLKGNEVSYRSLEVSERINHVRKPLKQAILALKRAGFDIIADGLNRINPNTGVPYKIWKIKFKD